MESKAKFLGHPLHQVLIVFPLGLLATGVIFDAIYLFTGNGILAIVAYWMIVAGIIGGFAAAPFGWVDWLAIPPQTRARAVGLTHGLGNMLVLVMFLGSWWIWHDEPAKPETPAHILAFAGAGLSLLTAWLGGELVARLGVGIDEGANLNAPNSLSGRAADE